MARSRWRFLVPRRRWVLLVRATRYVTLVVGKKMNGQDDLTQWQEAGRSFRGGEAGRSFGRGEAGMLSLCSKEDERPRQSNSMARSRWKWLVAAARYVILVMAKIKDQENLTS